MSVVSQREELQCAIGRFVYQYSLVGSCMVQTMEPGADEARATVLIEKPGTVLITEWHAATTSHPNATDRDKKILHALQKEARRLLVFRNVILHGWWVEGMTASGEPMLYSIKTNPRLTTQTAEEINSHALQASVVADAVILLSGLLRIDEGSRAEYRKKIIMTKEKAGPVVWTSYGAFESRRDWWSTDGRMSDEGPPDPTGSTQI